MSKLFSTAKRRWTAIVLGALAAVLIVVLAGCNGVIDVPGTQSDPAGTESPIRATPQMEATMELQEQYSADWMADDEIVGTAIGRARTGELAIIVFAKSDSTRALQLVPQRIGNIPVVVRVTGSFVAIQDIAGPAPQTISGQVSASLEATEAIDRYDRPVPIGVSTGNMGECSAGTIGVRVVNGDKVYALSNNHVYALENAARRGSLVVQPGLYDTACDVAIADVIGTLARYIPLNFSGLPNLIDAAIARTTTGRLGNATLSDGYGVPKSTVVAADIDMAVQKYGRTTSLTHGTITMVNAIVSVGYTSGTALFVGQILVESPTAFILPGDSGSLLVTEPNAEPVGLLFAGDEPGTLAIANPIQWVLNIFGVTIDGV
jgi:hypothetical protein